MARLEERQANIMVSARVLSLSLDIPQYNFVRSLLYMAGIGRNYEFHGSFLSKSEAVKKEREVGGFIRERVVKGKKRYFVLTEKK